MIVIGHPGYAGRLSVLRALWDGASMSFGRIISIVMSNIVRDLMNWQGDPSSLRSVGMTYFEALRDDIFLGSGGMT